MTQSMFLIRSKIYHKYKIDSKIKIAILKMFPTKKMSKKKSIEKYEPEVH